MPLFANVGHWQLLAKIGTMTECHSPRSILEFYSWKAANYGERIEHS